MPIAHRYPAPAMPSGSDARHDDPLLRRRDCRCGASGLSVVGSRWSVMASWFGLCCAILILQTLFPSASIAQSGVASAGNEFYVALPWGERADNHYLRVAITAVEQ